MARRWLNGTANVGTGIDLTPPNPGGALLHRVRVSAPSADNAATLKVYRDSAIAGNLVYDGHYLNRNADGEIVLPGGIPCTTKWIVVVAGGSGVTYVSAEFQP